jgi:hypothetical protein
MVSNIQKRIPVIEKQLAAIHKEISTIPSGTILLPDEVCNLLYLLRFTLTSSLAQKRIRTMVRVFFYQSTVPGYSAVCSTLSNVILVSRLWL